MALPHGPTAIHLRSAVVCALLVVSLLALAASDSSTQSSKSRGKTRGVKTDRTTTGASTSASTTTSTTPHPKPSKFDENVEDTIPVDIGENGTLIPDYSAKDKDKVGTIVLVKEDGLDDPPPAPLDSNAVLRKKFSRGKKKSLPQTLPPASTGANISISAEADKPEKDVDGDYGARIEKRMTDSEKTTTVTVSPLVLKRQSKRPKRSPLTYYDERLYPLQFGGNKYRRYVRFPLTDFPSGPGPAFRPSRPLWGAFPEAPPPGPVPRSPRLVFRDPVEPGTLQAPFFNNLQDLSIPDENRERIYSELSEVALKIPDGLSEK